MKLLVTRICSSAPWGWVLTRLGADSVKVDRMMILSPYEANLPYAKMKGAKNTTLHLYGT